MATANVELGSVARDDKSSALHGRCVRSEALTVSGTTATLATAVTTAEVSSGVQVVRISTDTACYVSRGANPDPTATSATPDTTARRLVQAGSDLTLPISVGEKVAVKALA